jgi:hypothetical protein
MEDVFTFPGSFYLRMVTPLYHEELDGLAPGHTILLIQELDVPHELCIHARVGQVCRGVH